MYVKLVVEELWTTLRQVVQEKFRSHPRASLLGTVLAGAMLVLIARSTLASFGGRRSCVASGNVAVAGQPIAQGSIMFVPAQASAGALAGGEIKAGRYRVTKSLAPGEYRVEIRSPRPSKHPLQVPQHHAGPPPMGHEEGIAADFNSATSLRVTVTGGSNRFDFDVTPAPNE
jgi:hypothetical protein